ncbi:hypothetical protein IEQ34_018685 [Dendrobium chrysotoxum]|uniref:Uncharacterized protein n=1 Tax=Dendrobium chrysotoxum TaxID=161865 RepID=A0AAV7G5B5_DENCH|nr:hypothetical protein IEQ34_018685 [Dendrobium chrysotoxum]
MASSLHSPNSSTLGLLFGHPLKADNAASVSSRPSLMRVLVELDITKKYPDKAWIGPDKFGYIQLVDMEALSPFCDHCKSIGHVQGDCRSQSSVPMNVHVISSYPLKSTGNEIGVLENVVVNGNAGAVIFCVLSHLVGWKLILVLEVDVISAGNEVVPPLPMVLSYVNNEGINVVMGSEACMTNFKALSFESPNYGNVGAVGLPLPITNARVPSGTVLSIPDGSEIVDAADHGSENWMLLMLI